jgi:membrane protease YdiL (CAAX protease family)
LIEKAVTAMAAGSEGSGAGWRESAGFGAVEVALFAAVFVAGMLGYLPISNTPWLFLLGSVLLLARGKFWGSVGLRWPQHATSALALGAAAGVALSVHELVVLEPLVRSYTGSSPDLSLFKELRGNLEATLFWIALSWVLAGFGEELVWRGYALNRLAALLGGTTGAWVFAAVAVNIVFGIAHNYQHRRIDLHRALLSGWPKSRRADHGARYAEHLRLLIHVLGRDHSRDLGRPFRPFLARKAVIHEREAHED